MDLDLIYQVSVCVSNMDAVLHNWKKYFNIDERTITCGNSKEYGWDQKYCRFDLGGIDFEIIEPLDKGPGNPYSDFLIENGGNGVHHIGVKFRDREKFVQNMEKLEILPLPRTYQGAALPDSVPQDSYFYDLRDMLGVILKAEKM